MPNHASFTVIVIEDEKLILNSIVKTIERLDSDFKVVATARDGLSGLELIQERVPFVVFTDVKMPIMGGIELIQKVSEKFPFIYTVIISGYNDFEYVHEALRNNVCDYLLKPINEEELKNTLIRLKEKATRNIKEVAQLPTDSSQSPHDIALLVQHFIDTNYKEVIDLNTLSNHFDFSPSYLTKIFIKYIGQPPIKYLTEYRINISKQLLHNSSYSIKTVAELCGYPDPFYFSKTFKKVVGISPLQYRNANEQSLPPE